MAAACTHTHYDRGWIRVGVVAACPVILRYISCGLLLPLKCHLLLFPPPRCRVISSLKEQELSRSSSTFIAAYLHSDGIHLHIELDNKDNVLE